MNPRSCSCSFHNLLDRYDNGIQTFDTANVCVIFLCSPVRPWPNARSTQVYSAGASEIILGKAIKQHNIPREEIVVMTKLYGLVRKSFTPRFNSVADAEKEGYVNQQGLSRKHIFDSVKKSLERLQLDYIDVLQCESSILVCARDNRKAVAEIVADVSGRGA